MGNRYASDLRTVFLETVAKHILTQRKKRGPVDSSHKGPVIWSFKYFCCYQPKQVDCPSASEVTQKDMGNDKITQKNIKEMYHVYNCWDALYWWKQMVSVKYLLAAHTEQSGCWWVSPYKSPISLTDSRRCNVLRGKWWFGYVNHCHLSICYLNT